MMVLQWGSIILWIAKGIRQPFILWLAVAIPYVIWAVSCISGIPLTSAPNATRYLGCVLFFTFFPDAFDSEFLTARSILEEVSALEQLESQGLTIPMYQTQTIWLPSLMHGATNAFTIFAYLSKPEYADNAILGPAYIGIIGMIPMAQSLQASFAQNRKSEKTYHIATS